MKKIFALALAAIMTASMATVAFAATAGDNKIDGVQVGVAPNSSSTAFETAAVQANAYVLSSSRAENVVDATSGSLVDGTVNFEGGDRLAIPLVVWDDKTAGADGEFKLSDDSVKWYTKDVDYKKPTIKADWKVGEAEVDVELVKFVSGVDNIPANTYVYCAVITLPENKGNKAVDLAGTIQAGTSSTSAKKGNKMSVELSYMPDTTDSDYTNFSGGSLDNTSDIGIVSFDKSAGEIDIDFDSDIGTVATFTVDVSSQGKLNMEWNTTFNKEFGKLYDYANLSFINFEGEPEFNKNGTMYIYADKETYLYEVTDDGAKAIAALPASGAATAQLTAGELNGLKWNEDYEAWEFKTRKLTSYVLSDVELDEQTVTEETSSSTTDGGKENPDTGR